MEAFMLAFGGQRSQLYALSCRNLKLVAQAAGCGCKLFEGEAPLSLDGTEKRLRDKYGHL